MADIILKAAGQTLTMVFWSTLFSVLLGFIPAIILTLTAPDGLRPNRIVYEVLSFLVNTFRSFPFVILMVIIIPLTRAIAGTTIGTQAAIVPLTVCAIPFIARVFENALRETDAGVIEAARSFGASDWHHTADHKHPGLFGHGRYLRRRGHWRHCDQIRLSEVFN